MPIPPPQNAERKFHGTVMDLWQWEQTLYDGSTSTFECVTRPDTTSVIPFLDPQTVLLTKQGQPHKTDFFLDMPGGRIDPGEGPHAGARRELQEETGYQAKRFLEWNRYAQRGLQRFEGFLFLATDLADGHPMHREAGEHIELVPTPWNKLVDLCLHGQLRQMNTMHAILTMEYDPAAKKRLHDWLAGV